MAIGLQTLLFSALQAQDGTGKQIDKARNDPKAAEKAAKADRLLLDKTKIFDEQTSGVKTSSKQQVQNKSCRKKPNGKRK